jgi:hypothetical protein
MQTNEVRICVNAGLFPQLAACRLQQRFVRFKMAGRLVPQRFAVDGLFNDQEFTLRVTTQATVT